MTEAKAAYASAVFALVAVVVSVAQYCSTESDRRYERDQIKYLGLLDREDNTDKFGTLQLKQVSGEPYLIEQVWILPSVPNELGGYVTGEPLSVGLLPFLTDDNLLPNFVIQDIGQLICHKNLKLGNEACDPTAHFSLSYKYVVFGQERGYREVITGTKY